MKAKLWLFFALIGMINAKAQEVNGILKNDSIAIQYANIILFKKSDSSIVNTTASGKDGYFKLKSSKKDSVFLQCSYIGYKDFFSAPFIGDKSFGEITISNDNELDVLELTAKRKPFKEISAHGSTFNISESPILKTGNAKRMITKLPGVQIKQGGNISVNGKDNATVYINGKRSYLEADGIVQYLQTLPAEDILKVEVFDVTPARFDAEGNGAIINIVIKKPPLGTNGRINLEVGYGNYYKISPTLSLNHRSEKSNVYGSFQWKSGKRDYYQIDSTVLNANQGEYIFNHIDNLIELNSISGKIGYDYYQNDKNTFGIF